MNFSLGSVEFFSNFWCEKNNNSHLKKLVATALIKDLFLWLSNIIHYQKDSRVTTNQMHTFFNHAGTLLSELERERPLLDALAWDGLLLESCELLDPMEMYSAWSSSWGGNRERNVYETKREVQRQN